MVFQIIKDGKGKTMNQTGQEADWVWVWIQDPGKNDQIVGQFYEEDGISFIPAFTDKDAGLKCYHKLAKDEASKYEVQAIHFNELVKEASRNDFLIFLLTEEGKIVKKIDPKKREGNA
jgi:hypothetical protein